MTGPEVAEVGIGTVAPQHDEPVLVPTFNTPHGMARHGTFSAIMKYAHACAPSQSTLVCMRHHEVLSCVCAMHPSMESSGRRTFGITTGSLTPRFHAFKGGQDLSRTRPCCGGHAGAGGGSSSPPAPHWLGPTPGSSCSASTACFGTRSSSSLSAPAPLPLPPWRARPAYLVSTGPWRARLAHAGAEAGAASRAQPQSAAPRRETGWGEGKVG